MALKFYPHNHSYVSLDPFENINWISVTTLIGKFKEPFDAEESALKASLKKRSKWYGIHPDKILQIWKNENKRSTDLGNWYHNREEQKLLQNPLVSRHGKQLSVISGIIDAQGIKIAPDQVLKEGIYPEHFVYLKSYGICGQSDEVTVAGGYVHIDDHKSNKDLKKAPYTNWDGVKKRLLPPLHHLEDSKLAEYSLQLSTYMYIILKHNPGLKAGPMTLNHVTFEEEGRDQFDYPIMKFDENGDYIVKAEEKLEVPYLKTDVETMLNYKISQGW